MIVFRVHVGNTVFRIIYRTPGVRKIVWFEDKEPNVLSKYKAWKCQLLNGMAQKISCSTIIRAVTNFIQYNISYHAIIRTPTFNLIQSEI